MPSIDEALGQLLLSPVLDPIRRLLDESVLRGLSSDDGFKGASTALMELAGTEVGAFLRAVADLAEPESRQAEIERSILADLEAIISVGELIRGQKDTDEPLKLTKTYLAEALKGPGAWAGALVWILVRRLGDLGERTNGREVIRRWLDKWYIGSTLADVLTHLGEGREEARRRAKAVDLMIAAAGWERRAADSASGLDDAVVEVFESSAGQQFLGVHRYDDVLWFRREALEELAGCFIVTAAVDAVINHVDTWTEVIGGLGRTVESLLETAQRRGYRVNDLLAAVQPREDTRRR